MQRGDRQQQLSLQASRPSPSPKARALAFAKPGDAHLHCTKSARLKECAESARERERGWQVLGGIRLVQRVCLGGAVEVVVRGVGKDKEYVKSEGGGRKRLKGEVGGRGGATKKVWSCSGDGDVKVWPFHIPPLSSLSLSLSLLLSSVYTLGRDFVGVPETSLSSTTPSTLHLLQLFLRPCNCLSPVFFLLFATGARVKHCHLFSTYSNAQTPTTFSIPALSLQNASSL